MFTAIVDRVSYPVLFGIAAVGFLFVIGGFVAETLGMYSLAAFFALYSAVAFLLSGVSYGSVLLIKNVSRARQRRSLTRQ